MKSLTFILLLILTSSGAYSQNLIPNGSFEDTLQCPNNGGQIHYSKGWSSPTPATPDFYHEASSTVSVPDMGYGTQYAKDGKAYAGIFTFDKHNYNGHDFIQVPLKEKLVAGKCYEVRFYVNLIDYVRYSCNDIGVYFSKEALSSTDWLPSVTPQIINDGYKNPLSNKQGWTLVSGKFIAEGGEGFLTIGNFKDDSQTDTTYVGSQYELDIAYYLVDDVSLYESQETYNGAIFQKSQPFSSPDFPEGGYHLKIYDVHGRMIYENINYQNDFFFNGCREAMYIYDIAAPKGRKRERIFLLK